MGILSLFENMAMISLPRRYTKLLLVIGAVILLLVLMQSFRALQIRSVAVDNLAVRDALRYPRETLPNRTATFRPNSGDVPGSDRKNANNSGKDFKSIILAAKKKIKPENNPSQSNMASQDEKRSGENREQVKEKDTANENDYDEEKEKEKEKGVAGEVGLDQNNDDRNSNDDNARKNGNDDQNENNDLVQEGKPIRIMVEVQDNNDVKSDENKEARALLADTEQVVRKLQTNCTFYKDAKPVDLQKTLETMRFYVKNADVCRYPGNMLIYVHSGAAHFERRQAIRETWGKREHLSTLNATLVFITGYVMNKPTLKRLRQEIRQHRDLVVAGFVDSYFNMTLKALTAMKWTMTYCSKRNYILKLDDDIFLGLRQMKKLIEYLTIFYSPNDTLVACAKWEAAAVMRSGSQKWCVSENEFPSKVFPPYCAGAAVLYNNLTMDMLYQVASKMSYFWIDDVFITGILTKKLGINIRALNKYSALFDHEIIHAAKEKTEADKMFYHTLKSSIMYLLWRLYSEKYGLR